MLCSAFGKNIMFDSDRDPAAIGWGVVFLHYVLACGP